MTNINQQANPDQAVVHKLVHLPELDPELDPEPDEERKLEREDSRNQIKVQDQEDLVWWYQEMRKNLTPDLGHDSQQVQRTVLGKIQGLTVVEILQKSKIRTYL